MPPVTAQGRTPRSEPFQQGPFRGHQVDPVGTFLSSFHGLRRHHRGLRRGQPLFLVFGLPARGLPEVMDTIPNFAGCRIRLRRRMHARAENVRRQILDEHGVVEWAVDLTRDAEKYGSVRLRPLLAFRCHLLAALLKCLLGFFGS
jgi:hypothetical protein